MHPPCDVGQDTSKSLAAGSRRKTHTHIQRVTGRGQSCGTIRAKGDLREEDKGADVGEDWVRSALQHDLLNLKPPAWPSSAELK